MKPVLRSLLLLGSMLANPALLAESSVRIEGQVLQPGARALLADARLFDIVGPAGVRADAYLPAAAWLHQPERATQRQLKTGVLFDLSMLARSARLDDQPELAKLAERLRSQIASLPVTGRRSHTLDPVVLELGNAANRPLADGDWLLYPSRPAYIRILGAVEADCQLPFQPLRPARSYLRDCARHPFAEHDWLYVIQPDGQVQRHGIALWNRDKELLPMPGATLLVPLRERSLHGIAEQLNPQLAAFIATQPLPMDDHGE